MIAVPRDLPHLALAAIVVAAATAAACHAVIYKREARSAALWIAVIWLVPALGPVLYFLLGINRVYRRAARLRAELVKVRFARDAFPRAPEAHFAPFVRLVDKVAERPLAGGNRVEMLAGGAAAYPAMLEAIDSARESLALASYIFHGDGIGAEFVAALERAARRGVETRVLVDDVGVRFAPRNAARRLRRSGLPPAVFNPTVIPARLYAANLRNHRKILIADGRVAFTGGMNIDRRYWRPENRQAEYMDTQFRMTGPVVAQLAEVFAEDWLFSTGEALAAGRWCPQAAPVGEALCRAIDAGPDESIDRLRWTLIGALNAARSQVLICTPYFIPDSALISALDAAALRGVEVDILLPGEIDLPHVRWAAWGQLWQVLERGCRVWESSGPFDHSKLMAVDGTWSFVGSANWDTRSLRLNFELNVECYDRDLCASIEKHLLEKRARSRRITLDEINARPLPRKLRDGVARLFAPYL